MTSWTLLALVMTACAGQPQPATIKEITFQSGEFTLVGELRLPAGRTGPFSVVLGAEDSMPASRDAWWALQEPVLEAGYAVLAGGTPRTGESAGSYEERRITAQRSRIVLDTMRLISHPLPRAVGIASVQLRGRSRLSQ